MSHEIKDVFTDRLPIKVTLPLAKAVVHYVTWYETKDNNSEALNSPYLGVTPIYFTNKDRDGFFDLFSVNGMDVANIVLGRSDGHDVVFGVSIKRDIMGLFRAYTQSLTRGLVTMGIAPADVRSIVSDMSTVDPNFRVASDPFNLFTTYVMYLFDNASNVPQKDREQAKYMTMMLLQYKFFTSLVNHRFPYKADEATMRATYESLSAKFDVKRYGTWKNVMSERAKEFLAKGSIHYKTIQNYDDDKKIIYLITDIQTRIRNQVNIVTTEYMNFKKNMDSMGTYSHMGTDLEGEKVFFNAESGLDLMIQNVYNDSLSVTRFIDEKALLLTTKLYAGVTITKLRALLITFSEKAVKDAKSGTSNKTIKEGDMELFIGAEVLIRNIIQKSYRYCIQNGVNLQRPVEIIKTTKDVYASSRISDPDIIAVRDSVERMVIELFLHNLKHKGMVPSYKLAFILYIVIISLKYLK